MCCLQPSTFPVSNGATPTTFGVADINIEMGQDRTFQERIGLRSRPKNCSDERYTGVPSNSGQSIREKFAIRP